MLIINTASVNLFSGFNNEISLNLCVSELAGENLKSKKGKAKHASKEKERRLP